MVSWQDSEWKASVVNCLATAADGAGGNREVLPFVDEPTRLQLKWVNGDVVVEKAEPDIG